LGLLAIAALGAAAWVEPAEAQYFGRNKVQYRQYEWRSITSDHFEIYFYPEIDSLARRTLDLAEKTHAVLSIRMGHSLGRRVPIILYGSHNDFAQTNVTPELIDAGTGGFTELLRNRVVLPFTGSYEDFRHVVVHELVHAMQFDMMYGGSAAAMLARQSFFQLPLWFAEGTAEYYSLGMESNAEMFLRDGTITGYLPPIHYSGGYLVYKQGQSAIGYLVERYGEERLRDLLRRTRSMRSFERAFQRSIGLPIAQFDRQWQEWLRKKYWPTIAVKDDPERFARRLTDHRRDESNANMAGSISPQGDRIAYFTDRRQYTDVYIMSAFDGKVLRRIIRGERGVRFEGIPSFRSSLSWAPDGRSLALTAKSGGRDVLYQVGADDGRVMRRFELDCDALYSPAWSPVSDSIVVVGVKAGRSDLYLVHASSGAVSRITNDSFDEKEPSWTPDGATITFASDRRAAVVLHALRQEKGWGAYGIYRLELGSRRVERVVDTHGDEHWPVWSPDGRRLAFISDRTGTPNLFLFDTIDSTIVQLTDVQGGVTSLSWARHADRLVFSAFHRGGWDVFAVTEPLSKEEVLDRLRHAMPQSVIAFEQAEVPAPDTMVFRPSAGALAGGWPDTLTLAADTLKTEPQLASAEPMLEATADSSRVLRDQEPPPWQSSDTWPNSAPSTYALRPVAAAPLPTLSPLVEDGGPFAVSDSVMSQEATRYRVRLAPEYAGGGLYASSFGVYGATQIQLTDFLGNHSVYLATDVFSDALSETNALVLYNYLPRRWDLGLGMFHFKNYYSSNITSLGEPLGASRFFAERSYGALVSMAYPFDKFRRVEFNFTQMFVERTFFDRDVFGDFFETGQEYRAVTSPGISLVGDNALYGYYGPVNGGRWNLSFSPSIAVMPNGLSYRTVTLDVRRYVDFTGGYQFATRLLGGVSDGRDPQVFRVGGFSTLRGYDDFSLFGTRMAIANLEMRFPFLGLLTPGPLGFFSLRGAAFTDFGYVWTEAHEPRLSHELDGHRRVKDLKLGIGGGLRTSFGLFILKYDVAWATDGYDTSKPNWYFSIGPEF